MEDSQGKTDQDQDRPPKVVTRGACGTEEKKRGAPAGGHEAAKGENGGPIGAKGKRKVNLTKRVQARLRTKVVHDGETLELADVVAIKLVNLMMKGDLRAVKMLWDRDDPVQKVVDTVTHEGETGVRMIRPGSGGYNVRNETEAEADAETEFESGSADPVNAKAAESVLGDGGDDD